MYEFNKDEFVEQLKELDENRKWRDIVTLIKNYWQRNYSPRFEVVEVDDSTIKLELSTGGWSENEEIIYALQGTMFWFFYWQKSERGGHYELEVKICK